MMIGIAQFAVNCPLAKAGHKVQTMANYKAKPEVTQEMYQHCPAMDLFAKKKASTFPTGRTGSITTLYSRSRETSANVAGPLR